MKKIKRVGVYALGIAASAGVGYFAAQKAVPAVGAVEQVAATAELPKVLLDLGLPDAKVTKTFDTGVSGVDGYVVDAGGDSNLVYTLEDGRYAMIGLLLGENQRNLSEEHAQAHLKLAANDPTQKLPQRESAGVDAEQALAAMQSAPFTVEEGTGDTAVYVSIDPNCPHCANYYREARQALDQATFHWVPVGFLGPESMRQSALLVESDDPLASIQKMQSSVLEGKPSQQSYDTIHRNTMAMRDAGLTMTPVSVYVYKDGTSKVVRGALNAEQIKRLTK